MGRRDDIVSCLFFGLSAALMKSMTNDTTNDRYESRNTPFPPFLFICKERKHTYLNYY
jgi:hypothetical protein